MQVLPPRSSDYCCVFHLPGRWDPVANKLPPGRSLHSTFRTNVCATQRDFRCFGAAVGLETLFCTSAGIPCGPPPDIPNGKHTGRLLSEFHYGTAVTYSCNAGFPLHGEPSIHCTTLDGKNGVWSEPLPACGGGAGLGEGAGTPKNPPGAAAPC